MIKLKKKIKVKRRLINGVIENDPDAVYNISVLLTSKYKDLGFFDVIDDPNPTATPNVPIQPTVDIVCSGTSRLVELEKYSTSENLSVKYITSTNINTNGLVVSDSSQGVRYVYYIDGFKYTDIINNGLVTTTIEYTSTGLNSHLVITKPIVKKENKSDVIELPKTVNDIFIDRQQISAFENNIKLRVMKNIIQLDNYAGGNYFNIINNT